MSTRRLALLLLLPLSALFPQSPSNPQAVRDAAVAYLTALRHGDAPAIATLARPNAARFSTGGARVPGLPASPGRTQFSFFVRQVEFLRPDAALVIGLWRNLAPDAPYLTGDFTLAFTLENGAWKINTVQETLGQPLAPLPPSVASRPIPHDGDWEILFDGKSAAHWFTMSGAANLGPAWRIEDNCLVTVPNAPGADLRSAHEYRTFELTWEWMAARGSNSGVKYRLFAADTFNFGPPRFAAGWEYQMADDSGDGGAIADDRQKSGALYGVVPVSKPIARPAGQWNESRLLVAEDHVEHWLNGQLAARYPIDVAFASPISLQHHGSVVRFRNIRIRPLPPPAGR